jgi:hypothetical protein
MNSIELADHLIFRAKNLHEFTVTTPAPKNLKFNGHIPFDISIKDDILSAIVYAVDFDEAATILNNYLEKHT